MMNEQNPLVRKIMNLTSDEISEFVKEIKREERIKASENFNNFIKRKMRKRKKGGKNNDLW